MDIFQGDPKLTIDVDGANLIFKGGQPVMDQGLENLALIQLFTRRGWCGNTLFENSVNQVGSDFEEAIEQPITIQALNEIRDSSEKALESPLFAVVESTVRNPKSNRIQVDILIRANTGEEVGLTLEKNGQNWLLQKTNPAYLRV